MQETTYNGWKNRETWLLALWFGNDEKLYKSLQCEIEECKHEHLTKEFAKNDLVDFFKDYVQAEVEAVQNGHKFIGDCLAYLDGSIDYEAVAESELEDYEPEPEEDE